MISSKMRKQEFFWTFLINHSFSFQLEYNRTRDTLDRPLLSAFDNRSTGSYDGSDMNGRKEYPLFFSGKLLKKILLFFEKR